MITLFDGEQIQAIEYNQYLDTLNTLNAQYPDVYAELMKRFDSVHFVLSARAVKILNGRGLIERNGFPKLCVQDVIVNERIKKEKEELLGKASPVIFSVAEGKSFEGQALELDDRKRRSKAFYKNDFRK